MPCSTEPADCKIPILEHQDGKSVGTSTRPEVAWCNHFQDWSKWSECLALRTNYNYNKFLEKTKWCNSTDFTVQRKTEESISQKKQKNAPSITYWTWFMFPVPTFLVPFLFPPAGSVDCTSAFEFQSQKVSIFLPSLLGGRLPRHFNEGSFWGWGPLIWNLTSSTCKPFML